MLSIEKIISESDTLVPNPFDAPKKVSWLNELNKDFFEIVKIPVVHQFVTVAGTSNYPLPSGVRSNNMERVQVGEVIYRSMQYENISPGHNFWIMDDDTQEIQLNPRPALSDALGIVKYTKVFEKTFTSNDLKAYPDAPSEYHWSYVLGLCEKIAKALNDVTLANNYGNDYRAQLMIAQTNYITRPNGE